MSDLVKRIDDCIFYADEESWTLATLLRDCRAEIERLRKPYVPMTDDEILELVRFYTTLGFPIGRYTKRVECEIIKRAGLGGGE
jgi:hypothetical protein